MARQTVAQAWNDYMLHGKSMGLAPATLATRESCTKRFLAAHGHRWVENVTSAHISGFFLEAAKTRSASSLSTTHAIMAAFFTYCQNTGKVRPGKNPMYGRRAPKVIERERLRIPAHRFPELLDLAEQRTPRDRAVVAVGLYTLLRDQEMAQLRIRDVELGAGYIRAIIFKSKTEDDVAISHDLDVELRRYLTWYQSKVGLLRPDMFLLPSNSGERVRDETTGRYAGSRTNATLMPFNSLGKMARVVTPLIGELGYPTVGDDGRSAREGAHTLRRSGARAYYDYFTGQGRADALRIVQTMLHHKNALQTQHYIGLREDRQTRDELVRGVSIFGFDQLTTIGGNHGYETDHRQSV